MILVDTSVWVDHLRRGNGHLVDALEAGAVACHPFVIGELACGSLRNRTEVLTDLGRLPHLFPATDQEVLVFIERRALMGRGIGYVDAHLLAAASLRGVRLWTLDRRLAGIASEIGVAT